MSEQINRINRLGRAVNSASLSVGTDLSESGKSMLAALIGGAASDDFNPAEFESAIKENLSSIGKSSRLSMK